MHYDLHYEITEEAIKNFTDAMIELYEKYKNNETYIEQLKKKGLYKQEDKQA